MTFRPLTLATALGLALTFGSAMPTHAQSATQTAPIPADGTLLSVSAQAESKPRAGRGDDLRRRRHAGGRCERRDARQRDADG